MIGIYVALAAKQWNEISGLLLAILPKGLLLSTMIILGACGSTNPADNDPLCGGDIQCAGSAVQAEAGRLCAPEIEKFAKYDFRWTDGALDPKLPNGRWSQRYDIVEKYGEKRIIEFQGDLIQMQNGFGAYKTMNYECDFDPVDKRIVAVRVFE